MKGFSEQRIGENGFIAKWQVGKEKKWTVKKYDAQWVEKTLVMEKKHVQNVYFINLYWV